MIKPSIEIKLHKAIKAISPAYLKTVIAQSDFDTFKNALSTYLDIISHKEHEINYVMHLKSFFDCVLPDNLIETQERIDLIIRKGKAKTDNAVVLFEAKKSNSSDMITPDNLNKKAFHEMILYFMRERLGGNTDIKHLIINTQTEFFIFNSRDFERLFYNNTQFKKDFEAFNKGEKTDSKTDFFYKEIAKNHLGNFDADISVTYFDLNDYKPLLSSNDDAQQKKLVLLYKIFSPEFLFNKPLKNDNNSLNKEFYNELLHIIGLHETKENNKYVIQRLPEKQRNPASLIENTIFKIQSKNKFSDTHIINQYGLNTNERAFNIALELCLVWINRLLFLKLLEAQIVSYHRNNPDYQFLNLNKIQDYDDLSDLFFEILAKKIPERHSHLQTKFQYIPYLNSSLFEASDLEDSFSIGMLNNSDLPIYKNTVLTDGKNKHLYTELKTLDYIFKFFDAYNFASDNADTVQDAPKTIINASVLGLIFEKINGYKDGSIFTPSYITMYMSKQVIQQAVIEKFKQAYHLDITNIHELKNYLSRDNYKTDKILEYNSLVNSIKICDPAVGSGHFLVSCLNELIHIKSYLWILADQSGKRITGYDFELDNDEIIILNDTTGETYQYNVHAKGVSDTIGHIQQTLFHEKQILIENCLFGVDINQNSVNICRLRLWIELLKNAYYTSQSNFTELETLPNIDINIKCGNALLSRFTIDDNLSLAFKNKGLTVTQYRNMVNAYKNTKDKTIKRDLDARIKEIKTYFRKEHIATIDRDIAIIERKIIALETQTEMFGGQDRFLDKHREVTVRGYEYEIKTLEKTKQAYETDLTFMNALEWRFEFPEILDDDGTFIGFDVVIGNPPYIQLQRDGGELAKLYETRGYDTFIRTGDIYILFYEKGYDLLSHKGILSFITSNKWLRAGYGEKLRTYLCHRTKPLMLIDLGANVFDNATVDSNILTLAKRQDKELTHTINASSIHNDIKMIKDSDDLAKIVFNKTFSIPINSEQWIILDKTKITIKEKLQTIGKPLKDWNIEINYGIKTGYNEAFIIDTETKERLCFQEPKSIQILKPILRGKDIKKWQASWQGFWLINSHNGYKNIPAVNVPKDYPAIYDYLLQHEAKASTRGDKGKHWTNLRNCVYVDNFEKEKIIYPNMSKYLPFVYDATKMYTNQKCFIMTGDNLKYLVAILNSTVSSYWIQNNCPELQGGTRELSYIFMQHLPIPNIPESEQAPFVDLTSRILSLTQSDDYSVNAEKQKQVTSLQAQIDRLVYALYGITDDEMKIIESSS